MPLPQQLSIDVKASGLKLALMRLSRYHKELEIDFNTLKAVNKNQNYVLSGSQLHFSDILRFEPRVKHITPDTLYFTEKTGFQKNVMVKVPGQVKCHQGYAFKTPEVVPGFVTIFGDTATLEAIDTIYAQALNLSDLQQNTTLKQALILPRPDIYSNVNEVVVNIEVEKLVEHSITIPVTDIQQKAGHHVNIFPAFVKLRFTARQSSFNSQDTALFKASINSAAIKPSTKKCEVFLSTVPGNVTVMEISPPEVELLILKKQ